MTVFRSYFSAQATLLRENPTSNGRNPIVEFSYGGAERQANRYVFRLDLAPLRQRLLTAGLPLTDVNRHEIRLKNVVTVAPNFAGVPLEGIDRGSGVVAQLYALPAPEKLREGNGYDYHYHAPVLSEEEMALSAPNWFYRTPETRWEVEGALTEDSLLLGECELGTGGEDLVFDVTEAVQQLLSGQVAEHDFLIRLRPQTEELLTPRRVVLTFFSRHTHHCFAPCLHTTWVQKALENRQAVPVDSLQYLLLSLPSGAGQSVVPVEVLLRDQQGQLISQLPGSAVEVVGQGLWRVPVTISSEAVTTQTQLQDEWVFFSGGKLKRVTQTLRVVDPIYESQGWAANRLYQISVVGLRHQELLSRRQAGLRRLGFAVRSFHNGQVQADCVVPGVEWRIILPQGREQLDVTDWQRAARIGEQCTAELDPSWLIPQFYALQARVVDEQGSVLATGQPVPFRVVG